MPSIYAKNNESINTNYSVTTNDENICPNQTLTPKRHSSSKVALSLSSSSPFSATATNKSRINNKKVTATAKGVNNISPKKRAPRVAKLAALYDDGQFKQSPHRGQTSLGVSGPSPIRSSKKKPAVVQSYDDKREFNGILQSPSQLSSIKDITNKSDIVNQASKATMEIIQKSASANEKDEKEANSGQHTKSSFNRAISQILHLLQKWRKRHHQQQQEMLYPTFFLLPSRLHHNSSYYYYHYMKFSIIITFHPQQPSLMLLQN